MDGRRLRTQSSRFLKTTPATKRSVTFVLPDPSPEDSPPIAESFIEDGSEDDNNNNNNNNNKPPKKKIQFNEQTISIDRERSESTEESSASPSENASSSNSSSDDERGEGTPSEKKPLTTGPPKPQTPTSTQPAKPAEKPKSKMIGRYDSFSSRATSIFHIRRGGMPLPNMQTDSKEPSEFVYANILRVDDDEEEMFEKEKQHSVGDGVAYITEVKYLEQEYKDRLLTGYKTNDLFYFGKDDKPKIGKVNKRVVGCGLFILLIISAIIATIFALVPNTNEEEDVVFDHSMVYVRLAKNNPGECQYTRECVGECPRTIERQAGCCIGCPQKQDNPLDDNCNFNVSVGWVPKEVEVLPLRQRIYLFASLDGKIFFQTGFAPPIVQKAAEWGYVYDKTPASNGTFLRNLEIVNSATETTVPNACFGVANQQIVLVACLSEYNLLDKVYDGFPAFYCNSFNGSCFNTNNAVVEDMDVCKGKTWLGNSIDSRDEWEKDFSKYTKLVKVTSIKRADRPKAEIEDQKDENASPKLVTSGIMAILFVALTSFVF